MKYFIRNVKCEACRVVVTNELEKMGFRGSFTGKGELEVGGQFSEQERETFEKAIRNYGFGLIDDRKTYQVEKIKHAIYEWVHYTDPETRSGYPEFLSMRLSLNYNYVSNLFSETTGETIEQYIIGRKIEQVIELLVYENLNLSEIAFRLKYSSVAHLSAQFKKVTGHTPTHFRRMAAKGNTAKGNL